MWRADAGHADGTSRNYDLGERTIPAHLMKTPVAKIRTEALRQLNARVQMDHGVDRTRLVHAVISGGLSYAWRHEWISENVALRVIPPAPKKRKDTTPTADELNRLLKLVQERPEIYAWILVSAMVGGRPSEILALRWSDLKTRTVTIQKDDATLEEVTLGQLSINKAPNPIGGGLKVTKTETERTVAIGPKTVTALEAWHTAFLARAKDVRAKVVADPFIFVRPRTFDGATPWRPDYGSKAFRKLRDKAGINPKIRRYDCRHYVATTLIDNDVNLKIVGERMGHTRLATTSDKYGHLVHASDQESAEIMERGLTA